jgi:hypothetical protein
LGLSTGCCSDLELHRPADAFKETAADFVSA